MESIEHSILTQLTEKRRKDTEGQIEEILYNHTLSSVEALLRKQTEKGFRKYGVIVEPSRLSSVEWIDHAMEELVDTLVYLQCLKDKLK
jgi:hypothetical protein